MRLIDADKFIDFGLKNKVIEVAMSQNIDRLTNVYQLLFADTKEVLDRQPTVDAVQVVRCNRCVHCRNNICTITECRVHDSDYCSYGRQTK